MIDYIEAFLGGSISDYPFLEAVIGVLMAGFVFFMLATIFASLFKITGKK